MKDEDLADLYRAAEVFVYPSLFEGFGLPPVEAMACGTPVVCSAEGALGEVVGDAAEIIDARDESTLLNALREVIQSKGRRASMVEAGLKRAELFDWNRAAEDWIELYRRTLSSVR